MGGGGGGKIKTWEDMMPLPGDEPQLALCRALQWQDVGVRSSSTSHMILHLGICQGKFLSAGDQSLSHNDKSIFNYSTS